MHAPIHHLSTKPPFARTKPCPDCMSISRRFSVDAHCSCPASHYVALPTPSPDLDPHGHHARHLSYDPFPQGHTSWDGLKSSQSPPVHMRNKRSLDYAVDDLFSDMKKRKVNPSYDSRRCFFSILVHDSTHYFLDMAERLNNIVYGQESIQDHSFNPRSISFDVRTPEELAAVNEFLVTLGRDVTGSSDRFTPFFDNNSLNELGLTGLPGLPTPAGFSQDTQYTHSSAQYTTPTSYPSPPTRSTHPSVQQNHYGSMYAMQNSTTDTYSTRAVSASNPDYINHSSPYATSLYQPAASPHSYTHSTPPLDPTSPHSSSSTPSNATPPHQPTISEPFQFDYVRAPRGAQPPIQLAAPDYSRKVLHNMVQLKSAPGSASEPVEPKLGSGSNSSPRLSSLTSPSTMSLSSHKIYPMLLPEDSDLKLPSLKQQLDATPCKLPSITEVCRSSSPPSRSPDASRGTTPTSSRSSPGLSHAALSSLRSITEASQDGSNDEHELARKVGKINLEHGRDISVEERRKHAELIRSLLVKINSDYKQRYGTPRPSTVKREPPESPRIQDIEMVPA